MKQNQKLNRRSVQDAMKRALFFIMDSTAILPLLAMPLLFSPGVLNLCRCFHDMYELTRTNR